MFANARILAGIALVAAFGTALFGVPSCLHPVDGSSAPVDRVYRFVAHKQYAEALPRALANRDRFPSDATALWQLARVYEGLGRPLDEAAAWEAYLQQSPPTDTVCLRLSDVYHQLDRPVQVVAVTDRCLTLGLQLPELLADQAAARLELGDRTGAITALRKAHSIDPTDPKLTARLRSIEERQ